MLKNEYEIRGDVTAIFLNSPKYGAMETLIATCDLPRAQELAGYWRAAWSKVTKSFYVQGGLKSGGKWHTVMLHRWLLNITDPSLRIDHILHDTLDNCYWAMNVVTNAENLQNCRLSRNNVSGYTGVSRNRKYQKWTAQIRAGGRILHLGNYEKLEDAVCARKLAEKEFYAYKEKIN